MKVALIGATGFVGTPILAELLQRGHRVTALVRHPGTSRAHPHLTAERMDVLDRDALARALTGHDAAQHHRARFTVGY